MTPGARAEAARQQALWAAITQGGDAAAIEPFAWAALPGPGGQAAADEGLQAYRRNARAHAHRSLAAAYPLLGRWLGEKGVRALSWQLWGEEPPTRGDLGLWGDGLASLLTRRPDCAMDPWLADMARLEWQLHLAARAQDHVDTVQGLSTLGAHDPSQLRLRFRPGTAVVAAGSPLWAIWQGLQGLPDTASESDRVTLIDQAFGVPAPQAVLVYRADLRVVAELAPDAEFTLALLAGDTLGTALRQHPPLDFQAWLLRALRDAWLVAVEPIPFNPQEFSP